MNPGRPERPRPQLATGTERGLLAVPHLAMKGGHAKAITRTISQAACFGPDRPHCFILAAPPSGTWRPRSSRPRWPVAAVSLHPEQPAPFARIPPLGLGHALARVSVGHGLGLGWAC